MRTTGRAVTRRSTRGSGVRSSHAPQASRTTTAAARRPRVVALPQPQFAPLETASSRATRPVPRPRAPGRSKRPGAAARRPAGTRRRIRTPTRRLRPAATQKRTRQSAFSATAAEKGRPRAPPTPMEALMRAMEPPSLSGGRMSRSRLMPRGTTPMPRPWRPRPTIIGTTEEASAQTTEPATSGTTEASRTRRLPRVSPRRPATGVATAPARRVAVITQEALDAVVSSSFGRSPMSGTTRVCMSAATMPASARTPTTPPGRASGLEPSTCSSPRVFTTMHMHHAH